MSEKVEFKKDGGGHVLELCSGTGVITTPVATYFKVIAVEKNEQYITFYEDYLRDPRIGTSKICDRIQICHGDLCESQKVLDEIKTMLPNNFDSFKAVILNPDFGLIQQALDIARNVRSSIIVAVLPLDVIQEAHDGESYRDREAVTKDVQDMTSFRLEWELEAVEPLLSEDGTAQAGTFLFIRASDN